MQQSTNLTFLLFLNNFLTIACIIFLFQGEVTHFVKEFEGKRGDQEVENLFKTFEVTTELQTTGVKKLTTTCDENLPTVSANLLVSESMCNKILDQAKNSELVIYS